MRSINLLPPKYKKLHTINRFYHGLIVFLIWCSIASILYGGAAYSTLRYLTLKNNQKIAEINQIKEEITRFSNIEKQIATINNRLAAAKGIKKPPDWEPILDEIAKYTPETIRITTLNFDREKSDVKISGVGVSRRAIVEYQLALESSPKFKNVEIINFGTTNSEAGNIINFSITVNLDQ